MSLPRVSVASHCLSSGLPTLLAYPPRFPILKFYQPTNGEVRAGYRRGERDRRTAAQSQGQRALRGGGHNIVGGALVLADGGRLHIDKDNHPDLFWAIRGGGGNFGVVTTFEFALHPVGPMVTGGLIVFPFAQAAGVLRQYGDYVEALDENVSVWAVLRHAPPLPFLPEAVHGANIVALASFRPCPSKRWKTTSPPCALAPTRTSCRRPEPKTGPRQSRLLRRQARKSSNAP